MELSVVIALVVGFVSLLILKRFLLPSQRLPPGPRPLPILGNLLLIKKSGSIFELANELHRTYGSIFTLWMGSTPAVVISGPDLLHDAMIKQGHVFNGRKRFPSLRIISENFRGFTTEVPERHRLFRKMLVSDLLSTSRIKVFKPIRDQEGDYLIQSLKKHAGENRGRVTSFRELIRLTVMNVLVGICFGRRLTMEEFADMDDVMTQRFKMVVGKPRDFIPILRWFPDWKQIELQKHLMKRIREFFEPLIEERRQALSASKILEKGTFVDSLLALQQQSGKNGENNTVDITDGDIVVLCLEILNAGSDTTGLNLEYAIANLINHQEIQEKLFQEIHAVVGERAVDDDDIPNLPYLQAVVKESLRRNSPGRFAPNRVAITSTKIGGYDIPANAIVYQHLEAIAMNPKIWENPLQFKPERFLNKNVDLTGASEISLIPFGAGRRICPAINLALLHGHLILARLVHKFQWKPITADTLLDLTPDIGLSAPMKYPLTALVMER